VGGLAAFLDNTMANNWPAIASIVLWVVVPIGIFIARNWIAASITKGVQHRFDREIEKLRADFRQSEERLKSELRDKEAEIAVLRSNVLAGSAGRQALLDKRRFDAVEKVWTAVNDLAQLKALSASMAVLNFKAVAKEASNPKMQQFLKTIGAAAPDVKALKNVARDERPFLPEIAWAYFAAYTTILYGQFMRFKVLQIGLDDADTYLTNETAIRILKAALPHQATFIAENEPEAYHYLLDEIESLLLAELRKILEGKSVDQETTARAREIIDAVKQVDQDRAKRAATDIT
jgi:hypothetical protein